MQPDRRDNQEIRSIAEKAFTLITAHEVVCAERYKELRDLMKLVYTGVGICLAIQTIVGLYLMLKH